MTQIGHLCHAPPFCKILNTPVMSICLVKQNDWTWVEKHQRFLFNVYKRFFIFVTFFTLFNVCLFFFLERFFTSMPKTKREKKHHILEGNAVPAGYCHAHMLIYVSGVNYNVNSNYTKYLAQLCCRFFWRFGKFPPQNEYRNRNDNVLLTLQSVTMIVTSLSSSTTREVYQMPKAEKPTGFWYWTSSRKLFAPLPLDRVTQESPSSTSVCRQFVAFVEGEICASVTARLFVCLWLCVFNYWKAVGGFGGR